MQKFIMGRIFLFSAFLFIGVPAAFADQEGADFQSLRQEISAVKAACGKVFSACAPRADVQIKTLFYDGTVEPEVAPLLDTMRSIATVQTEIWADTILEEQYVASNRPKLDRVDAIFRDSLVVAYRVVYSMSAWRVDAKGQHLNKGRIFEASFVSASLASWIRDEDAGAEFKE